MLSTLMLWCLSKNCDDLFSGNSAGLCWIALCPSFEQFAVQLQCRAKHCIVIVCRILNALENCWLRFVLSTSIHVSSVAWFLLRVHDNLPTGFFYACIYTAWLTAFVEMGDK